jgi:deoxyribodipyrimidine photo-lyase
MPVERERIRKLNDLPERPDRQYVLYWAQMDRRVDANHEIHGCYRMYWDKKVLEWSPTYQSAVDWMINVHGRYALDGRDPNTYTSILWCFGLHDRAWGERPVFGKIRYISGDSIRRKTKAKAYIREINGLKRARKDSAKVI